MGIFQFVKDAGAKIFGGETTAEANVTKATEIKTLVSKYNWNVDNFDCSVTDECATLSGTASDQSIKEKVILTVGNINGIASVDDKMTAAAAAEIAKFYTVKSGDTLGAIAKTYYGDPAKYPQIFEANKPMLEHPDKIYPGQTLRIPSTGGEGVA
jgi:nucleoid-associated protein YgaU